MLPPFMQEPDRPDNDMITANLRRIRAELYRVMESAERFDGTSTNQSTVAALIRQIEIMARRQGLSAEEKMTVLAYEALQAIERMNDLMIEKYSTATIPRSVIFEQGGLQQSNAFQPR
jgi:acetamidase/formamidase